MCIHRGIRPKEREFILESFLDPDAVLMYAENGKLFVNSLFVHDEGYFIELSNVEKKICYPGSW